MFENLFAQLAGGGGRPSFEGMDDAQAEEYMRKLGVAPPPRNPVAPGDYFAPVANDGLRTGNALIPTAGGQPVAPPQMADLAGATPAAVPEWFSPPAAGPAPGQEMPPTNATTAGVGKSVGQLPSFAQPTAVQQPFAPRFVKTNGVDGIDVGRTVGSRDEELAALAQQVASRTAAGLGGTAMGWNGNYYAAMPGEALLHNAGVGQHAADQFLRAASSGDDQMAQARQNDADRANRLQLGQLQAQSHVDAARAAHSPDAIRGAGGLKLMEMIAAGNVNPENIQLAREFINGGGGPAGGGAGGPSQDLMTRLGQVKSGREGVVDAANAFGGPDPATGAFMQSKTVGVQQAEDFADRLSKMDPLQRESVVKAIMEGKYGDRTPLLNAVAQAAAKNAYLAQGLPTDFRHAPGKDIPGSVELPYQNQPLLTLGQKPAGLVGRLAGRSGLVNGGVPWNQLTIANGPTIPFNPGDIGSTMREVGLGTPVNKETSERRAGLLAEALRRAFPGQTPPPGR